ncbi:MAG TPA: glycosyltransferase family 2 protein [Solirubrobacteraceae bacterium]|jgi:GT2 family glycosyltransferase|nr:glycosyltransferase family 2 protein [Solirubrobacteraceae bacterium]
MPEVVIAVVSWNTRDLLDACLRSLEAEVAAGRAEVWVVDNGSADGSAALVRALHPWAQVLEGPNVGFGGAVNRVAARTTTPWLAAANADVELTECALTALLRAGAAHPEAGAIVPQLVLADGQVQHSVHSFPTLPLTVTFNLGLAEAIPALGDRLAIEGRWNSTRPRYVDWALGAFVLVRRQAWDAVGGFDARQWMYAEDLDLGWRLRQAGWRTWYEPAAVVGHAGGAATAQAWGAERTEQWVWSTYAWMLRRRGAAFVRITAIVNLLGAAVRAALLTLLARRDPPRFEERRGAMLQWVRLHRIGLSRRTRLERHR